MLRTVFLRAARTASQSAVRSARIASQPAIRPVLSHQTASPIVRIAAVRGYASSAGLNQEEVAGRILDLLKNFDKVQDPSKLTSTSHFTKDLGLDSLDTVEVVMAIEEEFSIEIPDKEADAIHSVNEAVTYILDQPDAH